MTSWANMHSQLMDSFLTHIFFQDLNFIGRCQVFSTPIKPIKLIDLLRIDTKLNYLRHHLGQRRHYLLYRHHHLLNLGVSFVSLRINESQNISSTRQISKNFETKRCFFCTQISWFAWERQKKAHGHKFNWETSSESYWNRILKKPFLSNN